MMPNPALPVIRSVARLSCSINRRIARFAANYEQHHQSRRNASNTSALYLWIPKTAGTSLNTTLNKCGGQTLLTQEVAATYFKNTGIVTFGHQSIPALIDADIVSTDFIRRSWKFAIVRNPYDRAISLYEYLREVRTLPPTTTFAIFCSYLADRAFERIGLFNHVGLNQLNPQHAWLVDADGGFLPDYVGRFESIDETFQHIFDTLKIPAKHRAKLHENKSRRSGQDSHYYTDREAEIVRDVYAIDFETFGYSDSFSKWSSELSTQTTKSPATNTVASSKV